MLSAHEAAVKGLGGAPSATAGAPVELLFGALSDPTRRAMIDRLIDGPASVSELAAPLHISLPAVVQQLHVLEASGLVRSRKLGRVRTCTIEPAALSVAERWIAERRRTWEQRLDRLGEYLAEHPEHPDEPEQLDSRRKQ
jgi:DNA-binding transcriptional ArsR family regulator